MTRPQYEAVKDRQAEEALIKRAFPDCEISKLPIRYKIDYMVRRPGAIAWVECKQRTNAKDAYPTYMLSLDKYMAGMELARSTSGGFILLVGWSDARGWMNLGSLPPFPVRMGGRKDRGDDQDMEPVINIPISDFVIVRA